MQGPAALSKAASTKESQPSPTPSLTVARGNRVFEGILRGQRTVGNRVLASALGSATTPLDSHLRHRFERAFGVDLGTVRLHLGPAASTAARLLRAEAVTSGDDILFGGGKYEPSTQAGRQLLAHELAHVAQTRTAGRAVGQGPDYAEHERSAEAAAAAWKDGTLATGTINSLRSVALGTGAPAPMILRKADENQAEDYARAMALEMLDVDPASTSTDLLLHEARLLQGDAVAQGDRLPRSATAASHRLIELYGELSRRAVSAPHDQEGALLMPDQFGDLKPWTPRRPTRLEEVPPFSAENLSLWLTIESAAEPTAHPPSRQQARPPKPRPVPAEAAIVITSALQRREGTTRDKVTETTDAIVKYVTDLVRREFHLPARPSGPKEGAKPSSIAGGIALLRATSESEMLEQLAKSSTANLRAQDPGSGGAKAALDPKGGQTSLLDAAGQLYFVAEQVYAIDHYGNITPGENVHQYSNTNLAPGTYFVSPIYLSGAPHVVVMRIDSGVQIVSNPVLLASTVLWDWIPMVTSGQQVLKAGLGVAFIVGSDRSAPAVAKWENLDRVMARVPEEIPWAIGQAVLSLLEKYMLQNLGETIATEAIHRGLAELAEMIPE